MKVRLGPLRKLFTRFIAEHHFVLLLLALLFFIAYAGWVFWRDAYTLIKTPVLPDPLPSVSGPLFEELRADVLDRANGIEKASQSLYNTPFR